MKQLAVLLAALLSLTLVAPALAQPFADVPTDHWAYDAIAELAAKGLIEGYPDGAFRGDRAMTRYEMAMVVARLLARIEAIKIPPLPTDLTRTAQLNAANAANAAALRAVDQRLTAKLATIQRLVAEFRAELAALGVRVTAVEEELAAIRARLDNTRITGDMRMRYNVFPMGSISAPTGGQPDARLRARLTFTGTGGPNTRIVVRLRADNAQNSPGPSFDTRFGTNYTFAGVGFDYLYLDVRNTWGAQLWRVGRQPFSLAAYGPGGGLLYDPSNSGAASVSLPSNSGANTLPYGTTTAGVSDGIKSEWVLGPVNVTAAIFTERTPTSPASGGASGNPQLRDIQIVRGTTTALLPGWTLGGTYFREAIFPAAPAGCATVPPVPASCTHGGTGYGFDLSGNLMPGVSLYVDWASWANQVGFGAATAAAITAWRVGGNIDLDKVAGISTWSPNIDWEYHNYGPQASTCPLTGNAGGAIPNLCYPENTYAATVLGQFYAWNMRGWLARLNLTFTPKSSAYVQYEGGTALSTATSFYEWDVTFSHTLAPRTTLVLHYYKTNGPAVTGFVAGPPPVFTVTTADTTNFYRAELFYSW